MEHFGKLDFNISFNPTSAFPLDARTEFDTYDAALAAAQTAGEVGNKTSKYHYGMILTVHDGGVDKYVIQRDGTLKKLTAEDIDANDLGLEQDAETGLVYPTYKGVRSPNGIPLSGGNEVVTFNLIELGLPTIPADGTFVSLDMDTAEMRQALAKKVVKFVIAFSYGGLVLNGASFVVTPSGEQPAYQHTATLSMGNLLGFVTVLVSDTGVTAYARDINGYMDLYMEEALGGDY